LGFIDILIKIDFIYIYNYYIINTLNTIKMSNNHFMKKRNNYNNNNRRFNNNNGRFNNNRNNQNNNYRQNNYRNQQTQEHKLNTNWTIYVHDIRDTDWSLASYKKVYTITTIEDFWVFFGTVYDFKRHSFFFMRNDIKPVYEDPANKGGGSYSHIIPAQEVNETFIHVLSRAIGETLAMTKEKSNTITGISLVPKRNKSILKIWVSEKKNPVEINTRGIQFLLNGRFSEHRFE